MPLPETLPKASTKKKVVRKKADPSSSIHSAGLATAGESTSFSLGSGPWASDVSSNGKDVDERYIVDHRGNMLEYRDDDEYSDGRATEASMDDESFLSYLNNSIVSMGTTTESVSVSGSEASSNSSYSQIYEPRIIQKQRQEAKAYAKRSSDDKKLIDIPEDEPLQLVAIPRTPKAKTHKKPVSSWKKLFKIHRKDQAKEGTDGTPRELSKISQERIDELSPTSGSDIFDAQLTPQKSRSAVEEGEETENQNSDANTQEEHQKTTGTAAVAATGAGWLAISSWFSDDEADQNKSTAKRSPAGDTTVDEAVKEDSDKQPLDDRSKQSEDSLFDDLGSEKIEPQQVDQLGGESKNPRTEEPAPKQNTRRIPAILPMPMSLMKKRKDVRQQLQQQRQRILSILESEEQSTHAASKKPDSACNLEQVSDHDNLSLNPVASREALRDPTEALEEENVGLPQSPSPKTISHLLHWPSSRKKRHEAEFISEGQVERESQKEKERIPEEHARDENCGFEGKRRAAPLGKNHLRNLVVSAKAERLIHQSACRLEDDKILEEPESHLESQQPIFEAEPSESRCESEREILLEPEPFDQQPRQSRDYLGRKRNIRSIVQTKRILKDMDKIDKRASSQLENSVDPHGSYLGKKKTPHSILEEKRLLKEMDKIVKKRLKALEEIEREEANDHPPAFCGCSLLSC